MRTGMENHIRGTLKAFGMKLGSVSTAGFSRKVEMAVTNGDKLVKETMRALLKVRDALLTQEKALSTQCIVMVRQDGICKRLMTIPGVGPITALAFKAEIDDPSRFSRSRDVGVHLGLTPRKYVSGEVDLTGGISKCGNRAVRSLLFEASVTMLTLSKKWSRLKAWGVRLAQRNGFKAACTAVARKLAIVMHRMWVDGKDFGYGDAPAMQAA